jgi:hypothetical protein
MQKSMVRRKNKCEKCMTRSSAVADLDPIKHFNAEKINYFGDLSR